MEANIPKPDELKDLNIYSLGESSIDSPLEISKELFLSDDDKITVDARTKFVSDFREKQTLPPAFELAGPRQKIFFDPAKITCAIVTCGGICPGLNDVIRTITLTLLWDYKVKKVLGFRYGYEGLSSKRRTEPIELTPENVDGIQHEGGTILGSSRGPQELADMVTTLEEFGVNVLFVIGGDGTFTGAHKLAGEITKQKKQISVIGIPKTIDNDIYCSEVTFGLSTAVEEARKAIYAAHEEAKAAWNGIGIVKLMGRESGFIAAGAVLANSDVNYCLVPEVPFKLEGEKGLLESLKNRLARKRHAVIVVAEGAGQDLIPAKTTEKDKSGNSINKDIGLFLKNEIKQYFKDKDFPATVKYIDPSYTIRSCRANAQDSIYCVMFGQYAVHAAMAGKTDMFVGYWNHNFTHVPLEIAVKKRKKIDPKSMSWLMIKSMTE